MPTGYTAGILDGEIKDFKQFAKLCMRNFGATIHMRDDLLSAEYTPRTPSDYHTKAIDEAKGIITKAKELSDDEVIAIRRAELLKDREYWVNSIAKAKEGAEILDAFIVQAQNYQPPTNQHKGIKDFMVSQLIETKKFDCDRSYNHEKLVLIDRELETMTPASIRQQTIERAMKDLQYHEREHAEDLKRCEDSNAWVQQFLNSLV